VTVYCEVLSLSEELLVLSIKDGRTDAEILRIRELYEQIGDEVLFQSATNNKVVPMVAHGLMDAFPKNGIPFRWIESHQKALEKTNQFFQELDRLALLLAQHGVQVVVIENGSIAHDVYPCRGCFASNDIEILIDKQQLPIIDRVLSVEGYDRQSRERCASEDPQQWDREVRGWDNYCKTLTGNVVFWLNVQWQPVLRRWLPMEKGLTTAELISRSAPVTDTTSRVRVLSPEDNLLLCALHVASHSYVRGIGLRLQLDVDHLVRRVPIDWDLFLSRVRQYHAALLVFPSLAIPQGLFGTPVPDAVIRKLVPSMRKRALILQMISRASIFNRIAHKFNPLQLVALECALSEGGVIGSLRRIFFPPLLWIREGYGPRGRTSSAFYYFDRLFRLIQRRYA